MGSDVCEDCGGPNDNAGRWQTCSKCQSKWSAKWVEEKKAKEEAAQRAWLAAVGRWLGSKISAEEAEQEFADPEIAVEFRELWHTFRAQLDEGDELWTFSSPVETWMKLCGRAGFAIVRGGRVVKTIITKLN